MKVNGEEKVLEKEILLSEYLEQEGYQTGRIAVERNGEIIPKRNYKETCEPIDIFKGGEYGYK